MSAWLAALAVLAAGFVFGGMAVFSFVIAPLTFRVLEKPAITAFLAAAFPLYYAVMGAGAVVTALAAWPRDGFAAALAAAVAVGFALTRGLVLPRIERARPRRESEPAAARTFRRLHGLSMVINLAQVVAMAVVLVRLAV